MSNREFQKLLNLHQTMEVAVGQHSHHWLKIKYINRRHKANYNKKPKTICMNKQRNLMSSNNDKSPCWPFVISKFLKHHLKVKHTAPAYSQAPTWFKDFSSWYLKWTEMKMLSWTPVNLWLQTMKYKNRESLFVGLTIIVYGI